MHREHEPSIRGLSPDVRGLGRFWADLVVLGMAAVVIAVLVMAATARVGDLERERRDGSTNATTGG